MDRAQAAEALAAIAEAMATAWDTSGWVQDILGDETVGYCLAGAWDRATCGQAATSLEQAFRESVRQTVHELFPGEGYCSGPEAFNDEPGRSEEDVRLVAKHAVTSIINFMEFGDG